MRTRHQGNMGRGEIDTDQERPPLPPLPKERDNKQPTITSFFTKSPRKQPKQRDAQGRKRKRESNRKEREAGCEKISAKKVDKGNKSQYQI